MAYQKRTQKRSRFRWSYVFILVAVLFLFGYGVATVTDTGTGAAAKAAVIPVTGAISFSGDQFSQTTTPQQIDRLTEKAESSARVKAVIYEVNSGGGAAVASKKVAEHIKSVDKPTVCVMQEAAASGALWAATACDKVVADELTMTGSIGVTSSYLEFSGLLNRFNVTYVNLSTGQFKEMGSPYDEASDAERERFMDTLEQVHDTFVSAVAANRNQSRENVAEMADGRIVLGQEAKQLGLVDRLGGRDEALQIAEELSGEQLEEERFTQQEPLNLLQQLSAQIGYGFAQGVASLQDTGFNAETRR